MAGDDPIPTSANFVGGPQIHTGTGTNRCSRYNTVTVGVNYQYNPNSHKQNNYNQPTTMHTHKLNSEKLKIKLTNAYNEPTTMD
jgi:hypothetical protein